MRVRIAKSFTFDAAHHLPTMPPAHKCYGMHGHTYHAEIILEGPIESNGFMDGIDYADIDQAWLREVHGLIDHKVLNDVSPALRVPSTENLAVWIMGRLIDTDECRCILAVRLRESSTTWCEISAPEYRAGQAARAAERCSR